MTGPSTSSYLFGKRAQSVLERFVDDRTLFAFDLDGTLAPIVSDPDKIGIPADIHDAFAGLNKRGTVAVITGRSRASAMAHLDVMPRFLIGNHGAEGLPGWVRRENEYVRMAGDWQRQLDELLPASGRAGVAVENKGATLSVHYRRAHDPDAAHAQILGAVARLIPQPRLISGKCIENLLPAGAPDKGIAFRELMSETGFTKGLFAGDDETDEEIFELADENIFTIRVGKSAASRAAFFLRGQHEIARLLVVINAILDGKEASAK